MGSVYGIDLVAAVSEAGGLGALGCSLLGPDEVQKAAADIRKLTAKPFALNFLIFIPNEAGFAAALEARPAAMAFAWSRPEQDLSLSSSGRMRRAARSPSWPVMYPRPGAPPMQAQTSSSPRVPRAGGM